MLAVTFGWAAAAKVIRFASWRRALLRYRLTRGVFAAAVAGVPAAEAAIALAIVIGLARPGAALAIALLSAFTAAIARARAITGDKVPCGCFGKMTERDYRVVLGRNVLLAMAAAVVLLRAGTHSPLEGLAAPQPSEVVPAALVVAGIALIVWVASQLGSWTSSGTREPR